MGKLLDAGRGLMDSFSNGININLCCYIGRDSTIMCMCSDGCDIIKKVLACFGCIGSGSMAVAGAF